MTAPLAWVYGKLTDARRNAYARGWLETVRMPVPVICVGNVTVGGTGKTPATIWLLRHLLARGKKPAVLTRGYGRENTCELVVVSDGKNIFSDVRKTGDEPQLIARRAPVPVIASADRARGARAAIEDFAADVLVMDDGFQHHRLHRDLDVVLWDATEPLSTLEYPRRHLLPTGRLREPLTGLSRAGLIFLTKIEGVPPGDIQKTIESLKFYSQEKDIVPVRSSLTFEELPRGVPWAGDKLQSAAVLAVSAIARPAPFENALKRLGANVEIRRFRDHHFFSPEEAADLRARAAREKQIIITTEKDSLRLPVDFPRVVARLDWEPEGYDLKGRAPSWISKIDAVIS